MKSYKIISIHWGLIPGGVAKYAASLEMLDEHAPIKIRSVVINNKNWPIDKNTLKTIKPYLISIRGRWDLSWMLPLRSVIKKEKPDALFVFGFNGAFAGYIASIGLSIPILASWHGDYYASNLVQKIRAPFINLIEKIFYRHVIKNIIAVSRFAGNRLQDKGVPSNKIEIIHNGITAPKGLPVSPEKRQKQVGRFSGKILVGTCCRLCEQKGLIWMLDSIALVKKNNPDIEFVIWGDGPQRELLFNKAADLDITDILTFAGHVDNIEECLNKLDLFIMTSYAEYFSIALLEAMQTGLAIIATDTGGNPEAVRNGVDGILVPIENPRTMADTILTLASSKEQRTMLGTNAKKRYEDDFTKDIMIIKTAQWFLKILEQ